MTYKIQSNITLFFLLVLTATITGCNKQSLHGQFDTYEKRLTQLLEERSERLNQSIVHPPNNPTDLTVYALSPSALPEQQTISISDLNALSFCGLSELIAHHNSQLGKLAQPSQRFVYELTLIQRINQCDSTQLNESQQTLLASLKQHKVPQLRQHWYHFLTHSPALTRHFTAGNSNIGFPVERLQQQYFALSSLVKLQNYVQAISNSPQSLKPPSDNTLFELETHLSALDKPQLGNALRAIQYSITRLTHLNAFLHANSTLVACHAKRGNQHQEILNNIFQHYYVKQIQPNLSLITQDVQNIQPLLAALYHFQPQGFQYHYLLTSPQSQLQQLNDAFKQHAQWWVDMRKRCAAVANK